MVLENCQEVRLISKNYRFKAFVLCGYPEKAEDKLYNSQMVVSPDGTFVKSYRKAFLFDTDKTWAAESPDGF